MEAEKELMNNATVKVFENGIYSSTLSSIGEGWYQGDYPNIEVNYKMEVTVPGFEMVYAETSIPKYPVIIDTFFEKANSTPDEHGSYESKTTIIFQDDPNEVNYYHAGKNNYFNDITKETDPSILSDSDLKYNPLFYVFTDILFQGKVKNLTIMAGGSISLSPFEDGFIFYQNDYKRDFGPVSKEYYLGIKSWAQHYFNQNNDADINDPLSLLFKGEPTEMYSN
ncbi:DUF4249 family protein, partial [Brumimicrobium mesophilum]|uniref:DUF4249 family protein n=1 Tax=Brumimicrobium mesophilum TaxID=392717 RepID=UPI001F2EBA1C